MAGTYPDLDQVAEYNRLIKKKRALLSRMSAAAARQYDRELLQEIETKRRLIAAHEVGKANRTKSIFLSYTGRGATLSKLASKIAAGLGFEVRTGFDTEISQGQVLPDEIIGRIRSSSVFLGLWTVDFDAQSRRGRDGRGRDVVAEAGGVPGVWMPFELGVAAAAAKPFKILFESGVHNGYITKPFATTPHFPFEDDSFEAQATSAIASLNARYHSITANVDSKPALDAG